MGLALASTGSSTLHNDNEPNCEFFYWGNQQSQLQQISYFELLSSRVMMRLIERWWILWYRDVDDVLKVCIIAQTVGKCNMKTYQTSLVNITKCTSNSRHCRLLCYRQNHFSRLLIHIKSLKKISVLLKLFIFVAMDH